MDLPVTPAGFEAPSKNGITVVVRMTPGGDRQRRDSLSDARRRVRSHGQMFRRHAAHSGQAIPCSVPRWLPPRIVQLNAVDLSIFAGSMGYAHSVLFSAALPLVGIWQTRAERRALAECRNAAGGCPMVRRNARLNEASD
jgi:hypothetical protein